ncbi:myosin-10-like [Chrysoperla carnea]|uniref:myosin-10-like n=1 Tax=Chrysoperla carnea TaxID=189513 RepID=UPI001D083651|nr:myosin-10-like [Chrysoperla carnea]
MGQAQSYDLKDQNHEDQDPWWSPQSEETNHAIETKSGSYQSTVDFGQHTNSSNQNNECTINTEDNLDNDSQQFNGYSRTLDSREKLEIFKKHLEEKRLERQSILSAKKREFDQLRTDLEQQKIQNRILSEKLKELASGNSVTIDNNEISKVVLLESNVEELAKENERLKSQLQTFIEEKQNTEEILKKNKELQIEQASLQHELQSLNKQISESEQQKEEYIKHIAALKDIIKISKQMILIREGELKELKLKVALIETTLADREAQVMSNDLREEYERQLQNIRNLRTLYEERSRISRIELQNVKDQLTDTQQKLESETTKSSELEQRINELETDVSQKYDNISSLESNLGLSKAECRGLKHEMAVINQLFAQFLLGFNSPTQDVNLDKLVQLLEENHDLLTDITVKDDSDETALPRLLLHLVNETDKSTEHVNNENLQQEENSVPEGTNTKIQNEEVDTGQGNITGNQFNSPEEIVTNLPKVWRVLMELLSHQVAQPVEIDESCTTPTTDASNPCYKSVETPGGTRYVLSVSKTYIRLKDLIMEKKYLQKEMLKMKTLNTRLESRLHEQESRLHIVTKELSKTWHIVGRLQRQHEQLHTNEQILCYELRQKRKMLNELKEELELCKGKWKSAREKNKESEHECRKLRSEFASRRSMAILESGNNSAESGYSDEQEELDSEDDDLDDSEIQSKKELEERFFITDNSKPSEINCDNANAITEDESTEVSSISEESISENVPCSNITDNSILPTDETNEIPKIVTECQEVSQSISENCDESNTDFDKQSNSSENLRLKEEMHVHFDENVEIFSSNSSEKLLEGPSTCIENSTPLSRARESIIKSENAAKQREERFKRLEEHCQQLKQTYTNQTQRGTDLSLRLDNLHQQFSGESSYNTASGTNSNVEENTLTLDGEESTTTLSIKEEATLPISVNQENTQQEEPTPSTSTRNPTDREERFKRLEEQCRQLKQKYSKQTKTGTELCSKLDNIHQQFSPGSSSNGNTSDNTTGSSISSNITTTSNESETLKIIPNINTAMEQTDVESLNNQTTTTQNTTNTNKSNNDEN